MTICRNTEPRCLSPKNQFLSVKEADLRLETTNPKSTSTLSGSTILKTAQKPLSKMGFLQMEFLMITPVMKEKKELPKLNPTKLSHTLCPTIKLIASLSLIKLIGGKIGYPITNPRVMTRNYRTRILGRLTTTMRVRLLIIKLLIVEMKIPTICIITGQ